MSAKGLLVVVAGLALACGADDAGTGAGTEEVTGTGGSTEGATTSASTSTGTAADPTTIAGGSSGDTGPVADSGSETAEPTTEGCPVGTEGCPCDDGRSCEAGLECSAEGVCEAAAACRALDPEPHGDEATATMLGNVGCDSVVDLGVIGTLDGPETDWYRYFANEGLVLCTERPEATVVAAIDVEVCAYIECLEGNASGVSCAGGSSAATSPENRPGCCGQDQARIDDFECGGFLTPKNVNVWVSIGTSEQACVDYELSYAN